MQREPVAKRAFAFIDASNTRGSARRAFGDAFGNFNPVALAEEVCAAQGWALAGISYYLGVPDVRITEDGHYTWMKRCARWRKQGVRVFTRTLQQDEEGTAREKGIDMRLALDAVSLYRQGAYDIALIFSQDQDFVELATELRAMARELKRQVQVFSAFPAAEAAPGEAARPGGIAGAIPIPLALEEFRKVLDTPENRKRMHSPLALPPQLFEAPAVKTARPQTAAQAPPPARRGTWAGWAVRLALLYLAAAAGTFLYLGWTERAQLAPPSHALPVLADHASKSLVWPSYWLDRDDVRALKSSLPQIQAFLKKAPPR